MTITQTSSGQLKYKILRDGKVVEESDWIHNLRLPYWLNSNTYASNIRYALLYNGAKKTIIKPTGTASVSFDVDSGKWRLTASVDSNIDFLDHRPGDRIKFLNGDDVMISGVLDSKTTELASYNAKDIAAQEFRVYRTGVWKASDFGTPAAMDGTTHYDMGEILTDETDTSKGERVLHMKYFLPTNTKSESVVVETIAFGLDANPHLSDSYAGHVSAVVNLPTSISVLPGDQLTFEYEIRQRAATYPNHGPTEISMDSDNFPYSASIASISSNGTEVTLVTTEPHYREVDDRIKVEGTTNFDSDDDDPTNPWSWRVSAKVDDNTLTLVRDDSGAVPPDTTTESAGTFRSPNAQGWVQYATSSVDKIMGGYSGHLYHKPDLFQGVPTYDTISWSYSYSVTGTRTTPSVNVDSGYLFEMTQTVLAPDTLDRIASIKLDGLAYYSWSAIIIFKHPQQKPLGYVWTFKLGLRQLADLPWT